jgi:chromosomal replication initiation ATPase DnaA
MLQERGMTDLSTVEGQFQHYAQVRYRLTGNISPDPIELPILTQEEQMEILDRAIVAKIIEKYPPFEKPVVHSIKKIQTAVCDRFGCSFDDLISQRRGEPLVTHRHIAVYLCRTLTKFSYPQIARFFGDRDHTTLIHSFRRVERLRRNDAALDSEVVALESLLKPEAQG